MSREILLLVDALAHEKSVSREIIFEAVEEALASATKKIHKDAIDIKVEIDQESGEYKTFRKWTVLPADLLEDEETQISLDDDRAKDLVENDIIKEPIESVEFGRIGAQAAKQVILQKVREAEREQILNEFLARDEKLVSGQIRRMERGNAIIEIGRIDAVLPREQMIPKENLRIGDRVRAIVMEVDRGIKGPQLILSRVSPEFLIRLFELEVPEIEDGIIDIRTLFREPGDRTKIIVESHDKRIDAVGACVGMKGSRIQVIVRELNGEKIDIINYTSEPQLLVTRALSPAKPYRVTIDYEKHRALALFEAEDISIAIGKNGQNVRLASKVTGFEIDAKSRSEVEGPVVVEVFLEEVEGLPKRVVSILAENGIDTVNEVVNTSKDALLSFKGLGEKTLDEFMTALMEKVEVKVEVIEEVVEVDDGAGEEKA